MSKDKLPTQYPSSNKDILNRAAEAIVQRRKLSKEERDKLDPFIVRTYGTK